MSSNPPAAVAEGRVTRSRAADAGSTPPLATSVPPAPSVASGRPPSDSYTASREAVDGSSDAEDEADEEDRHPLQRHVDGDDEEKEEAHHRRAMLQADEELAEISRRRRRREWEAKQRQLKEEPGAGARAARSGCTPSSSAGHRSRRCGSPCGVPTGCADSWGSDYYACATSPASPPADVLCGQHQTSAVSGGHRVQGQHRRTAGPVPGAASTCACHRHLVSRG